MILRTRLSIEECKVRLATAVDIDKKVFLWIGHRGSNPIIGKFRDDGFRLQKRRRDYRNDFGPLFYGRLINDGGGTIVAGEFSMHPATIGFMLIWLGGVGLLLVAGLIIVATHRPSLRAAFFVVVPVVMMALGILGVKRGQWLGRSEESAIAAFLKTTLEADELVHTASNRGM